MSEVALHLPRWRSARRRSPTGTATAGLHNTSVASAWHLTVVFMQAAGFVRALIPNSARMTGVTNSDHRPSASGKVRRITPNIYGLRLPRSWPHLRADDPVLAPLQRPDDASSSWPDHGRSLSSLSRLGWRQGSLPVSPNSEAWRVTARPRRRHGPAATGSNAPATSRTRRGFGAGRRCRSSR
jgi:hypothetical protein